MKRSLIFHAQVNVTPHGAGPAAGVVRGRALRWVLDLLCEVPALLKSLSNSETSPGENPLGIVHMPSNPFHLKF